jgi:hypothetical protein
MAEMQIVIIMLPGLFIAALVFLWVFTDELARRQRDR